MLFKALLLILLSFQICKGGIPSEEGEFWVLCFLIVLITCLSSSVVVLQLDLCLFSLKSIGIGSFSQRQPTSLGSSRILSSCDLKTFRDGQNLLKVSTRLIRTANGKELLVRDLE